MISNCELPLSQGGMFAPTDFEVSLVFAIDYPLGDAPFPQAAMAST